MNSFQGHGVSISSCRLEPDAEFVVHRIYWNLHMILDKF